MQRQRYQRKDENSIVGELFKRFLEETRGGYYKFSERPKLHVVYESVFADWRQTNNLRREVSASFSSVLFYLSRTGYLRVVRGSTIVFLNRSSRQKVLTQKNVLSLKSAEKERELHESQYCSLCQLHIQESPKDHLQSKTHRKNILEVLLANVDQLTKNKGGVIVSEVPKSFNSSEPIDFGELVKGKLTIKNTGNKRRGLRAMVIIPPSEDLQVPSMEEPLTINIGDSFDVPLEFEAPSCSGVCRFVVIFHFGTFQIGRILSFSVLQNPTGFVELLPTVPYSPPQPVQQPLPSHTPEFPGPPPPRTTLSDMKRRLEVYPVANDFRKVAYKAANGDTKALYKLIKNMSKMHHFAKLLLLTRIEEVQMEIDIRNYDMKGAKLGFARNSSTRFSLKVPGLAERRPSVLYGDKVFVTIRGKEFEGYVYRVEKEEVHLEFHREFSRYHVNGAACDVRFTFSRTPLRRMYQALYYHLTTNSTLVHPQPTVALPLTLDRLSFFDRKISNNKSQKKAVKSVVKGCHGNAPYLIFGPPGTGKTITMVECIKQIYCMSGTILACAPSNSAADLLIQRIMKQSPVQKRHVVRINAFQRPFESVPEDVLLYSLHSNNIFELPSLLQLSRYRIVVTTCVSAGWLYSLGLKEGHFTHIFIDEAGHALEAECFVSLSGLAGPNTRVVLAGDPKQLGPIVRSPIAKHFGLQRSYLERLSLLDMYSKTNGKYNSTYIAKLLQNYRSHPAILQFPNEKFYEGELVPEGDPMLTNSMCGWEELPNPEFPIIFCGLRGQDMREGNSPSWFNPHEASQVMRYIQKLKMYRKCRLRLEDIGVISPYHRQVQKIRQLLQGHLDGPKIGSVEEFQGQERKVIIISTVRASTDFVDFDYKHNLGFLKNPKRFNVAITRAQALLIVIGDPFVLQVDPQWGEFLRYCVENGGYTGCKLPRQNGKEHDEDDQISAIISKLASLEVNDEDEQREGQVSSLTAQENPEWRDAV